MNRNQEHEPMSQQEHRALDDLYTFYRIWGKSNRAGMTWRIPGVTWGTAKLPFSAYERLVTRGLAEASPVNRHEFPEPKSWIDHLALWVMNRFISPNSDPVIHRYRLTPMGVRVCEVSKMLAKEIADAFYEKYR